METRDCPRRNGCSSLPEGPDGAPVAHAGRRNLWVTSLLALGWRAWSPKSERISSRCRTARPMRASAGGLATRLREEVTKAREVLIKKIDEVTAGDFSEQPRGRSMDIALEGRQAYAGRGSERVLDNQKGSAGEQAAFDFGHHFAKVART